MLSQFPVKMTKSVNIALGHDLKLVYLFRPSGYPYGLPISPYRVTPRHAYMNMSRKSNTPMLLTPGSALMMVYIKIRSSFRPLTILNRRMILNVLSTATQGASPGTLSSMTPAMTMKRSNRFHGSSMYVLGPIAVIRMTTSAQYSVWKMMPET